MNLKQISWEIVYKMLFRGKMMHQFIIFSQSLIYFCYFVCIILITLCFCCDCLFSMSGLCSWITLIWFPLASWFPWLLFQTDIEPKSNRPYANIFLRTLRLYLCVWTNRKNAKICSLWMQGKDQNTTNRILFPSLLPTTGIFFVCITLLF